MINLSHILKQKSDFSIEILYQQHNRSVNIATIFLIKNAMFYKLYYIFIVIFNQSLSSGKNCDLNYKLYFFMLQIENIPSNHSQDIKCTELGMDLKSTILSRQHLPDYSAQC